MSSTQVGYYWLRRCVVLAQPPVNAIASAGKGYGTIAPAIGAAAEKALCDWTLTPGKKGMITGRFQDVLLINLIVEP